MPQSELRLVKRISRFVKKEDVFLLPRNLRGIYVLYKEKEGTKSKNEYAVVYVGMATVGRGRGIRGRIVSHGKSKRKAGLWTHFAVYEVWDNIRDEEIAELEGLLRYIYRHDPQANALNVQKGFKKAQRIRENDLKKWSESGPLSKAKS